MDWIPDRLNRILFELEKYLYPTVERLPGCLYQDARTDDISALGGDWRDFDRYDRWGTVDSIRWFRFSHTVPPELERRPVLFKIRTGREGEWYPGGPQYLVYVNGRVKRGMDLWHETVRLSASARAGEIFDICIQGFSGVKEILTGMEIDIISEDRDAQALYYDIKTVLDAALLLPPENKRRHLLLNALNEAANLLDMRKPLGPSFYRTAEEARELIAGEIYGKGNTEPYTAWCPGHTHLDLAWLWTVEDSRRKAARTFTTHLELMELYPEYQFMCGQPLVYRFVKEDFPEIFEKVRKKVEGGRWEPEGAMWVEPDCNIPSGESLARQLLYGKQFFREEFGVDSKILWLPDSFGFTGSLPQILKLAGVDYFGTTKLSWNDTNKMPYDLFMWRGIDGTEIFSCFTLHHAAYLGPKPVKEVWDDFKQKNIASHVLVPFGWGDAGGGPTEDMLEAGVRMARGIPGNPTVRFGKAGDFFRAAEAETKAGARLPAWTGELYLEYHRGTYTTMAANKRYNRKCEFLLQDAEMFSVLAEIMAGAAYPAERLRKNWEKVLLNQFHDILPGSSVKAVYEVSRREYEEVLKDGGEILKEAAAAILRSEKKRAFLSSEGCPATGNLEECAVFNALSFPYTGEAVVENPPEGLDSATIGDSPAQKTYDGKIIFYAENIPAKGYKTLAVRRAAGTPDGEKISASGDPANQTVTLETPFFRVTVDAAGALDSLYDKRSCREVLRGRGNVLQAFDDLPYCWNDAWDIAPHFEEKTRELNTADRVEIIESGPVRTVVRVEKSFMQSRVKQDIILYARSPRIDFATVIDWRETHVMLKVLFPVSIHSEHAVYDIPFGNISRPTHRNTNWDSARFEVCGHKWADLSQGDRGVSLLNDCKYGYDIAGGNLRLTLLKSPDYPNTEADRCRHTFTYSLFPHLKGFAEGGTVQEGYKLNDPPFTVWLNGRGKGPAAFSLFQTDAENVFLESVKKAEDGGGIIVRLYEAFNMDAKFTVSAGFKAEKIYECDLLERVLSEIPAGSETPWEIKPYEIKTYKYVPR
ncbi:MAG: alpha-mannosidase [Clostridiales bacterium]|jgi:alpha-mannosidase|nr:alpha-mannosidase [Clostridiales bacterium]